MADEVKVTLASGENLTAVLLEEVLMVSGPSQPIWNVVSAQHRLLGSTPWAQSKEGEHRPTCDPDVCSLILACRSVERERPSVLKTSCTNSRSSRAVVFGFCPLPFRFLPLYWIITQVISRDDYELAVRKTGLLEVGKLCIVLRFQQSL